MRVFLSCDGLWLSGGVMQALTYKSVAERLECSPRTVRRLVAAGRLPVVRLTRDLPRVPEDALNALICGECVEGWR